MYANPLKIEYNRLIGRWNKAELNESGITAEHIPKLLEIRNRLGELLDEIGFYVEEDALNGFKDGGA